MLELPSPDRRTDLNKYVEYDVPFFPNDSDRCVPVSVESAIAYFLSEAELKSEDIDNLCGYAPGREAWKTQSLLSLAALGFEIRRIEDDDLYGFASDPEAYMKMRFPDPAIYQDQMEHSDIPLEVRRVEAYLDQGLHFEERKGTQHDIQALLDQGWLVQLFINGSKLFGKDTITPHVVLAVGYDTDVIIVHNADGLNGNIPSQKVAWKTFEEAWDSHPSAAKGLSALRWGAPKGPYTTSSQVSGY